MRRLCGKEGRDGRGWGKGSRKGKGKKAEK